MARKYRQRGYQDEDRPSGPRERRPPRERREGPRGRGLGAPTETSFKCARCGHKLPLEGTVAVDATCRKCGADLHTCTNCVHFDTSAPNECREPVTVRIAKKASRNECELFAPKAVQGFARDSGPDDPRSDFDALFDF